MSYWNGVGEGGRKREKTRSVRKEPWKLTAETGARYGQEGYSLAPRHGQLSVAALKEEKRTLSRHTRGRTGRGREGTGGRWERSFKKPRLINSASVPKLMDALVVRSNDSSFPNVQETES